MKKFNMALSRKLSYGRLFALGLFAAMVLVPTIGPQAADSSYVKTTLVSDALPAKHTDPNLVNAWGIAFNPNGFVWIAANGTGVSTLYDGNGNLQSLVVTIPPPAGGTPPSAPTGIVFNSSTDFEVSKDSVSGASAFIFATEDGTISGWSPKVDATNAILAVDNSAATGAVYKGLALAGNGTGHFLYATDFHNGKIDVFDSAFEPAVLSGSFADPLIPEGFAPFGIRNINGNLYVTYAKQDADRHDDVKGNGRGFVNVFDANGNLIRRFASRGILNSPWGLAVAPANFGEFSNRLLIGNFGDGKINAFDIATGKFLGALYRRDNVPITVNGLWGLDFGNGVEDFPTDVLFFTAGPNGESHGLFGKIKVVPGS
jgi:uncharacterized protein (TIGR03118 family)